MRAYHFTSSEHGTSDVALKRMKIATLEDLNDPLEFLAVSGGIRGVRESAAQWKNKLAREWGMLCFSKAWHSPVLWSHYGFGHTGMCLGFDLDESGTVEVEYVPDRLSLPIVESDNRKPFDVLVEKLLSTKYEHYIFEDEVRMFVHLVDSAAERGLYFYEFSEQVELKEIILGPLCEIPVERIRGLASDIYDDVKVVKAELAYKFYKVVPGST